MTWHPDSGRPFPERPGLVDTRPEEPDVSDLLVPLYQLNPDGSAFPEPDAWMCADCGHVASEEIKIENHIRDNH